MQAWEEKALEREDGRAEGREEGRVEGRVEGREEGAAETLIRNVEEASKNFKIDLKKACEGLGTTVEEYQRAKEQLKKWNTK